MQTNIMVWSTRFVIPLILLVASPIFKTASGEESTPFSTQQKMQDFMFSFMKWMSWQNCFSPEDIRDMYTITQTFMDTMKESFNTTPKSGSSNKHANQAIIIAFASSMIEMALSGTGGASQREKTDATLYSMRQAFLEIYGVVNEMFMNEMTQLISLFAQTSAGTVDASSAAASSSAVVDNYRYGYGDKGAAAAAIAKNGNRGGINYGQNAGIGATTTSTARAEAGNYAFGFKNGGVAADGGRIYGTGGYGQGVVATRTAEESPELGQYPYRYSNSEAASRAAAATMERPGGYLYGYRDFGETAAAIASGGSGGTSGYGQDLGTKSFVSGARPIRTGPRSYGPENWENDTSTTGGSAVSYVGSDREYGQGAGDGSTDSSTGSSGAEPERYSSGYRSSNAKPPAAAASGERQGGGWYGPTYDYYNYEDASAKSPNVIFGRNRDAYGGPGQASSVGGGAGNSYYGSEIGSDGSSEAAATGVSREAGNAGYRSGYDNNGAASAITSGRRGGSDSSYRDDVVTVGTAADGYGGNLLKTYIFYPFKDMFGRSFSRLYTPASSSRVSSVVAALQSSTISFDLLWQIIFNQYNEIYATEPDLTCFAIPLQVAIEIASAVISVLRSSNFGCIVDKVISGEIIPPEFNFLGCDKACMRSYYDYVMSFFM